MPIAKPALSVAFDLKEQRRLSLDLGEPVIEFFANMFPGFLKNITIITKISSEDMAKLAVSYIEAIEISSMHTREDMTRWFDANFPSLESTDRDFKAAVRNFRVLLTELAVLMRPMIKMFRVALGLRLSVIAISSYADMVTDVLVTIDFFKKGQTSMGAASVSCVCTALLFQFLCIIMQYHGQKQNKKSFYMGIITLVGLGPLLQAWEVFRGIEQGEGMMCDPSRMLATTKAIEILFESLPESILQATALLSTEHTKLSTINYIGIGSSLFSAGFILTDANLGICKSLMMNSPNNPYYNMLPGKKARFTRCMSGYALFTTMYFSTSVFTSALVYLKYGGTSILRVVVAEVSVMFLYKHFVDGELLAYSLISKPSRLDPLFGLLVKFAYYLSTCVTYIPFLKNPCELGAHVAAALIVWRMVTNSALVVLTLPGLVDEGTLPWMTVTAGLAGYFSCLFLSWLGAFWYWGSMADRHQIRRWWMRQTGKQHIEECWDDENIWFCRAMTKDEEMANWFNSIHPIHLPMTRIKTWITVELVGKYSSQNEMESSQAKCPPFMTQAFKLRILDIFSWWGRDEELAEVKEALDSLPTFVEVESLKKMHSRITKERSKKVQVHPAEDDTE